MTRRADRRRRHRPDVRRRLGLPDIAQAVGEQDRLGSGFGSFLGNFMMVAAVLSMIGLFIGNSVGGTRMPFALSEDGMMPKFLVRVHRKWGTPWIAIILCGVIFSVFSLNAFAFLVVIDVLLNSLTLFLEFVALWRLRISRPEIPRKRIPGGWIGALHRDHPARPCSSSWPSTARSRTRAGGPSGIAICFIIGGAVLYFAVKYFVKRRNNIPDVDPCVIGDDTEPVLEPVPVKVPIV